MTEEQIKRKAESIINCNVNLNYPFVRAEDLVDVIVELLKEIEKRQRRNSLWQVLITGL